ncbi:MAG: hypothetical protein VYD54_07735 [Bdellovibrionota bacterium]|nr:hypothetical protein [Bdellovibrionota bacterium]
MNKKEKSTSIATNVIIFVIAINLLVSLIALVIQINQDKHKFNLDLNEKIENLKKGLAPLEHALNTLDEKLIMSFLKGQVAQNGFQYTFIEGVEGNEKGKVLYEFPAKVRVKKNYYKIKSFEVFSKEKELLGMLGIIISRESINKKINEKILFFILIQLIQVVINVILIHLVFKFLVANHLKKMVIFAKKLNLDDLDSEELKLERRTPKKPDELETLISSFNLMKKNLNIANKNRKSYTKTLERKVNEATAEIVEEKQNISILLNNIKIAVFAIGEDFKVLPPVSKYSESIFGEDIVGKKVSDFLFYNIRRGTQEFRNLSTVFSIIFESDELQFFVLEDNLPKVVTLPDKSNKKGKTLKLSYGAFYNENNLLKKLMCIAEDTTESQEHLKKAEEDQENYQFITEIMEVVDKEKLGRMMEQSLKDLFEILEDFVSPLSDTYTENHFHEKLRTSLHRLLKTFQNLKLLKSKVVDYTIDLKKFELHGQQINPQVEATIIICDVLETLLRYSGCVDRFTPVNLNFNLSFTNTILEKIKDMEKVFKNLFEYVFLVREINNIDKDKLQKVVQVAKLYPEFERTIDLIQQRARLLSFLLKGVGEEELSSMYQNLSSKVKIMPERSKLTEFIIENNLIEPYKEVLVKTKDIGENLPKRVKNRQKEFLTDKGYLQLLADIVNRFIREHENGADPSLPALPKIDHFTKENLVNYQFILKQSSEFTGVPEEVKKGFNERSIVNIENVIRRILKEELAEKNAIPVEKKNKNFIKFLKDHLPKKDS